jgi:hypothetical protein
MRGKVYVGNLGHGLSRVVILVESGVLVGYVRVASMT